VVRNTVAIGGFGGTEYYYRISGDAVYYQQIIDDFVVSVGGSFGITQPYGQSSVLRLTNRFFLGGDTLRGFQVGGVGPRDAVTQDALGGRYYYTTSAELSFPLLGIPKELGLIGKAFVDAGSLWGADDSINVPGASVLDSSMTRVGTGVGIQWISPFGPIRIDYAFPVVQAAWDKTQNIRFSFGTRF
jgi:outer membrane protein insertion porin family